MRQSIDLNADLAEGAAYDQQLLQLVSSAHIACGWHAGSLKQIRQALEWAQAYGVVVGAHPSLPDRLNFGRVAMQLPQIEIYDAILYQLGALNALCEQVGTPLQQVKPHGALYNQANLDAELAKTIVKAVNQFNPQLRLVALAGSLLLQHAQDSGLTTLAEGFADRAYHQDGSLVSRTQAQAVHTEPSQIQSQALQLVQFGSLNSLEGPPVSVTIETLCVHGDTTNAVVATQNVQRALTAAGIAITNPYGLQRPKSC